VRGEGERGESERGERERGGREGVARGVSKSKNSICGLKIFKV